jgi:outer membrane lipoprotein-sorting protein
MIRRTGFPAAVLLLALLVGSCAPKRSSLLLDTRRTSASALLQMVVAGSTRVHSMTGRGSVAFESPDLNGSAYVEVSLKKPDSLLAKFEGPFGIDIGILFFSRRRFVLYNSLENRVTTGVPSTSAIRSFVPFDLTFDQILDVFSGVFSLEGDATAIRDYTVDGDHFVLTTACGSGMCEYWIDPESYVVTRSRRLSSDGAVLLDAEAGAFVEQDGVVAPKRISITFPEQNRRVSVFYTSFHLNVPEPSFAYSIPPSARTSVR